MIALGQNLGIGIYTAAEAAFYARVSTKVMSRWVFGDASGRPVIERQRSDPGEKVVTFLDFVQTLAVREVRYRHGLSLQKIRRGVDEARTRYGIEYPLACKHTIYLFGDPQTRGHGEILIRLPDGDDDHLVQVTGRSRRNLVARPVVELFLEDLHFDPATRFAREYRPMARGGASIVLDPHRHFGEPLVDPGGYLVETLWHATNTEGGIEPAARAYGVTPEEVRLANRYYDMLSPDLAA